MGQARWLMGKSICPMGVTKEFNAQNTHKEGRREPTPINKVNIL